MINPYRLQLFLGSANAQRLPEASQFEGVSFNPIDTIDDEAIYAYGPIVPGAPPIVCMFSS